MNNNIKNNSTQDYKLFFKNHLGMLSEVASFSGELRDTDVFHEAMRHIHKFCEEIDFKIYYVRLRNYNGQTVFDYGSHTEFFYLIPEVNWNAEN